MHKFIIILSLLFKQKISILIMKKYLFLFLSIFSLMHISAQYEAGHWFFGVHAGMDFTSGAPVPESGSRIDTEEGCSAISNACGDLLLYTDGVTIWNANHQTMLNGTGLNGDASSTQSGIVVPNPVDDNIYYVFTVDAAFSGPSGSVGMQYSVVDMTLDGGLGGVVTGQKNIRLVNSASEKVTAVISSDGSSVWVLTLAPRTASTQAPYATIGSNLNTFYAFKVTGSGVANTATISTLALSISGGIGYMKASPDGRKIAIANAHEDDQSAFLLDFNDVTGEVSNPVALPLNMGNSRPYGLEFSPDSSKLYLSDWYNKLTQFDLSNNNTATIISTNRNYRAALQLGLDGKIYRPYTTAYGAGSNDLSVIERPNEAGTACNYRHRYVQLTSSMEARQGLPPFIQSYFVQVEAPDVTADFLNNLEVESNEAIASVDWDFGDGTTMTTFPDNPPDNTHSQAQHSYDTPGTYTVTAILHLVLGCDVTVTKTVVIPPILDTSLTNICADNLSGVVSLDLHSYDNDIINLQTNPGTYTVRYYISSDDALSGQNEILTAYTNTTNHDQLYYAITNTTTGTTSYGTFYLTVNPKPEILAVDDYKVCDSDTDGLAEFDLTTKIPEILGSRTNPPYEVKFYPTQTDAEAVTNEITTVTNYTNATPDMETMWYLITNTDTGCTNTGSFNLVVLPLIEINMDDVYLFCVGQSIQIEAPAGFVSYEWSTGETTQDIIVNTPGDYTVTVTNADGCSNSKTITVEASDVAVIDRVDIKDFSPDQNNQITVYASGLGDYEYSLDGINYQDENTFDHIYPGTYTVYVSDKNACGVVTKEIDILGSPQFFTPNGDGFNDVWQIINVEKRPAAVVSIYDRYGKLIKVLTSASSGWDGTVNGVALPADDYWFVVKIKKTDGTDRTIQGHFTLKR